MPFCLSSFAKGGGPAVAVLPVILRQRRRTCCCSFVCHPSPKAEDLLLQFCLSSFAKGGGPAVAALSVILRQRRRTRCRSFACHPSPKAEDLLFQLPLLILLPLYPSKATAKTAALEQLPSSKILDQPTIRSQKIIVVPDVRNPRPNRRLNPQLSSVSSHLQFGLSAGLSVSGTGSATGPTDPDHEHGQPKDQSHGANHHDPQNGTFPEPWDQGQQERAHTK